MCPSNGPIIKLLRKHKTYDCIHVISTHKAMGPAAIRDMKPAKLDMPDGWAS